MNHLAITLFKRLSHPSNSDIKPINTTLGELINWYNDGKKNGNDYNVEKAFEYGGKFTFKNTLEMLAFVKKNANEKITVYVYDSKAGEYTLYFACKDKEIIMEVWEIPFE